MYGGYLFEGSTDDVWITDRSLLGATSATEGLFEIPAGQQD